MGFNSAFKGLNFMKKNPSSGSRVVPCGRTEERTWRS